MRQFLHHALLLIACAVAAVLTAPHAMAGEFAMSGQGTSAYKKKKESENARQDAERAAVKDALRKALSKMLTRDQMKTYADQIETDVLPVAKTFVERHQLVDQSEKDKVWTVIVKATFDEDTIAANLDGIGFSMDVGQRRSIAILVDELFSADLAPSDTPLLKEDRITYRVDAQGPSERVGAVDGDAEGRVSAAAMERDSGNFTAFAERVKTYFPPTVQRRSRDENASATAIAAKLLARDARLADAGTVAKLRHGLVGDRGMMMSVANDPATLSKRAIELGRLNGVDALMVGTTGIVYNGDRAGRHSATATLGVRIVDCATGDIVAAATTQATGVGGSAKAAAGAAATRLGEATGLTLGDQLFTYWKKRDEKGVELLLRFVGITATRTNIALEDTLRGVDGTESIRQRNFDRTSGVAEYVVTTRRAINEYKSDMIRALYGVPDFANLEEETSVGTNLNFSVK
ncbi:MAG: hypothetical protein ACON5B_17180 [Myxococcota bacterium]